MAHPLGAVRQALRDSRVAGLITRVGGGRIANSGPVLGLLVSFESWGKGW